jgi:hypothetical protein
MAREQRNNASNLRLLREPVESGALIIATIRTTHGKDLVREMHLMPANTPVVRDTLSHIISLEHTRGNAVHIKVTKRGRHPHAFEIL